MTPEGIVSWLALKALSYNLAMLEGGTIRNPVQITNCDVNKLEKSNHKDSMVSEFIFAFKKWMPLQSCWPFLNCLLQIIRMVFILPYMLGQSRVNFVVDSPTKTVPVIFCSEEVCLASLSSGTCGTSKDEDKMKK